MKKIFLGLATLLAFCSSHARPVVAEDISGIFVAQLHAHGPFYVAQLLIQGNGVLNFRDASIEAPMPKPGCYGVYQYSQRQLEILMDCTAVGGPADISQVIDFTGVEAEDLLSSEGAEVTVYSSLMGNEPMPFKVRKQETPYFTD